MGKRIVCECGNTIVFEGEVPKYYRCGKCSAKIKVDDCAAESVDHEGNTPHTKMMRRKKPGQ